MTNLSIIRAWKDEEYRASLSETDRALLPEHPAGLIELSDGALDGAAGGNAGGHTNYGSVYACPTQTYTGKFSPCCW